MPQLAWHKKLIGYLYPITIDKQANSKHAALKIKYYQGQYQLESGGALYSDGYRYSPFRLAYNYLYKNGRLENVDRFLLLGAGLGSALLRLQKKYNLYPKASLVEYDADILSWCRHYLLPHQEENVAFLRKEALDYLKESNNTFDLIGIDLFEDLKNSYLITEINFWSALKSHCDPSTTIILNTIFEKRKDRIQFDHFIGKHFEFHRLDHKPNYIYILNLQA